jgi:hypothetical protein
MMATVAHHTMDATFVGGPDFNSATFTSDA